MNRAGVYAALDIGSGSTKLLVCRAEIVGNAAFKLKEILVEKETEVLLQHDLEHNGGKRLSDAVLQKCRDTILGYKQIASQFGATHLSGIGTQVFRTAENGDKFMKSMKESDDIDLRIVSQQEEGEIGFATAATLAGEPLESSSLISWDSGGASFQLACDQGRTVFKGPMGSSSVTAALVRMQGKKFEGRISPNPVEKSQLEQLASFIHDNLTPETKMKPDLAVRIASSRVVAIGGDTSAFNICRLALHLHMHGTLQSSDVFPALLEREKLGKALEGLVGKTDEQLVDLGFVPLLQPDMVLPKLCLVHTVMTIFNISVVEYYMSTGSCLGVISCAQRRSI